MVGLCRAREISPEACDWVKYALDPFHDLQLENLKGYPDVSTEPTVVVKIRQAIEISAPEGLDRDANWDCHLALSPIDYAKPPVSLRESGPGAATTGYNMSVNFRPNITTDTPGGAPAGWIRQPGQNTEGASTTQRVDGLMINSVPSQGVDGAEWTYTPGHMPTVPAGGYEMKNIVLDDYLDFEQTDLGAYRVLYSGFEVVNTTAQIYKQGAVTVYEYGNTQETSQAIVPRAVKSASTGAFDSSLQSTIALNTYRSPPNTIAEAKIMPGSHTWPAQDGCYVCAKFQTENPFQAVTQRNYVLAQNQSYGLANSGYGTVASGGRQSGSICSPGLVGDNPNVTGPTIGSDSSPYNAAPCVHISRMNTAGAYFTGLSYKSTLFVTWKVGIERLPAANKPTFLALATPSASFDPNALVLYNLVAHNLPPGCPQGWNDLGRWYNTIADVARAVIPRAYPIVNAAQMIMKGLGASQTAIASIKAAAKAANSRSKAAQKIQTVARARPKAQLQNSSNGQGRMAVSNFGAPPYKGKAQAPRRQTFGQMGN